MQCVSKIDRVCSTHRQQRGEGKKVLQANSLDMEQIFQSFLQMLQRILY